MSSGPRGGEEQKICDRMSHPERGIVCTVCVDPVGRNGTTGEKNNDESGQNSPRGPYRLGEDGQSSNALAKTVNGSGERGGQTAQCRD